MAASWQESEIIAGLFVGDLQDAQKFDGTIISVLPDVPERQWVLTGEGHVAGLPRLRAGHRPHRAGCAAPAIPSRV